MRLLEIYREEEVENSIMSYRSKWRQSISKDFKYTNDNYFAFSPPPRISKETLLPRNSSKF